MNKWINQNKLQTPYYVFDLNALKTRASLLHDKAAANGVSLCYAVKANAFLTPYLADQVDAFEVCSHGEFKLCKKQGLDLSKVVLSGVNKEEAFVEDAILSGAGILTAESMTHFHYIQKYSRLHKKPVKVILRLSCNAQFGMDRSVLEQIIANRADYEYIKIIGIHYFTGTQKRKAKKMIVELDKVSALIQDLKERYGYDTKLLEYGPGAAVSYFRGDDFENDMLEFDLLLEYIRQAEYPYHVTLEMGRFFVASCGSYVTGIADCKVNDGMNVCIIDGGKNHLNYYGQNMALKTPVIRHYKETDGEWTEKRAPKDKECAAWTLFGSLCSFHDIIARDVALENPEIGDRLVFENVGAYSVTEGMYLFLSRSMPEIYFYENGALRLVRERMETFELNG